MKRKICFIITNFIHYSRNLLVLDELNNRPDVELHVVLGGAAVGGKYVAHSANIAEAMRKKGFQNIHHVHFNLEGSDGITKAKTAGLGMIEFASVFQAVSPDLVVIRGDRFETLSAAGAAAFMNIPVAHIEGGDVTGTIDESVRHAVTKLANIHFPTNEPARARLMRMGEHDEHVFNYGSPDIEVVRTCAAEGRRVPDLSGTGSGAPINTKEDFLIVMFHPVTSEVEKLSGQTQVLLSAVHDIGMQALWFWPNFDAGAEEISRELRGFQNREKDHRIRFLRYLPPEDFIALLSNARVLLGNSSAGIKECSILGVPVVNVGTRQDGRLRAINVLDCDMDIDAIVGAARKQLAVGRYPGASPYAGEGTSRKIAEKLATVALTTQKKFAEHDA